MRRWFGALIVLLCLCGVTTAQTLSYPQRPITIIVTAAVGGVTDVVARALGQELSTAWHQPVVIENRGGAAHILGAQAVAKADPDGYTLLAAESGAFTINPTLYPKGKLPYDTDKDFVPISGLVRVNHALLADRSLPVANVSELIALAKEKPGRLTYGTAGIGSMPHMNMALFQSMAGVKLVAVHYRGATHRTQRSYRRPYQSVVVQRQLGAAAVPGRPGEAPWDRQRQASAAARGCADYRRDGARFSGGSVVRAVRHCRHAKRDCHEAQRRGAANFQRPGIPRALPRSGNVRTDDRAAARVRRLHQSRTTQMVKSHSRRRHQARIMPRTHKMRRAVRA